MQAKFIMHIDLIIKIKIVMNALACARACPRKSERADRGITYPSVQIFKRTYINAA